MTIKKIVAWIAIGLGGLVSAHAQIILTNTTLSAAIADGSVRTFNVASATNINAPSYQDNTKNTYLYVDRELMNVETVQGTLLTVTRGLAGTIANGHAASATVFLIPGYLGTFWFGLPAPAGLCTRTSAIALPVISPTSGTISDCLGGQWVDGNSTTYPQPNGLRLPDPGGSALTGLETAGTAPGAATSIYCTEIDLPSSQMITGLGVLNGTTVGTDNHWVLLYDATGNLLANSAVAGALSATASVYQKFNFTAKYFAPGPAKYFGCVGSNGATATLRHAITAVNDNVLAGAVTGQVFGTAAGTITVPTTFTTATGAYLLVY